MVSLTDARAVWVPLLLLNPCCRSLVRPVSTSLHVSRRLSVLSSSFPWMSNNDIGLYLVTSLWLLSVHCGYFEGVRKVS